MQIVFKKAGKKRVGTKVIEVTKADVEAGKPFSVDPLKADFFLKNPAVATLYKKPTTPKAETPKEEAKTNDKQEADKQTTPKAEKTTK